MQVHAKIDLTDVERGFTAMARVSYAKVFRELRPAMKQDTRDHVKARSGPDGGWPPRAAATMARLRRSKRRTRPMGRLPSIVSYRASARGLVGQHRLLWSGVQSYGGVVGNGAKLPARPFLWMSDEFLAEANKLTRDAVLAAYGRQ